MDVFVVRVWEPAEPLPAGEVLLRGVVEHVGSGDQHPFVGGEQLLAFVSRRPQTAGKGEGDGPE